MGNKERNERRTFNSERSTSNEKTNKERNEEKANEHRKKMIKNTLYPRRGETSFALLNEIRNTIRS